MKTVRLSEIFPTKTRLRLVAVWLIVILFLVFGQRLFGDALTGTIALGTFLLLLFTIIGAAFGVVKEADALAHKLGEPYGTLILTLSVVSIEVILIAAVLLGPGENPTIGKDSIFSVMMIIMNLVMGLCILLGGLKFGEQEYNAQGTLSYMAMIILLGGIGLLLPNFIQGEGDGAFTTTQAVVLSGLVIVLYGFFLLLQMKRYKHLYQQPKAGSMGILFTQRQALEEQPAMEEATPINTKEIGVRTLILLGMILPIVLLSHNMAAVVDYGIKAANLPPLLGGVLIAIIVFTPESMTAIKAALNNEFQRAINLCHGAFVSTVGLTIPAVLLVGLITRKTVLFGMTATETLLFIITLLLSLMTFIGKRTTPIMGMMHLVLFVVFILLIFNP